MIWKKSSSAFTLIEMLIVIVIIGILAAALIPRLQSIQSRARDTKRKVDFRTLSTAISIYKIDNDKYPVAACDYYDINSMWCVSRSTMTYPAGWIYGLTWYITSLPKDPINNVEWDWDFFMAWDASRLAYTYVFGSTVNNQKNSYALITALENIKDPDLCDVKHWQFLIPDYNSYGDPCTMFWYTRLYIQSATLR